MRLIFTVPTMLYFLLINTAIAQSQYIDGVWLLAANGCELSLSLKQLEELHRSGGNQENYKTILTLFAGSYNVETTKGNLCAPEDFGFVNKPGNNMRVYCGSNIITKGNYKVLKNNQTYFNGEIVTMSNGVFEILGTPSDIQPNEITLKKGVLIIKKTMPYFCGSNQKLITYYIPIPLS